MHVYAWEEAMAEAYMRSELSIGWELMGAWCFAPQWVEVKMRELGVLGHPNYRLTCMLDHAAMVTVATDKYGGEGSLQFLA